MLKHHMVVLYDSIFNSVFQSQVLTPLLMHLDNKTFNCITLVTYERNTPDTATLSKLIPQHKDLSVVVLKRPPFFGTISLWLGMHALKKLININNFTSIMARGPLAGWIVLKACKNASLSIMIQARGLCAEEYRYAEREHCPWWRKPIFNFLYKTYTHLERTVYGTDKPITIEAVSAALKKHLETQFKTPSQRITLAHHDIPKTVAAATVATWRMNIRQHLNIASNATVYCYSGSYKAWQCAHETIEYFVEHYGNDEQALLLILTPDIALFEASLKKHNVSTARYRICKVQAHEVLTYLAASDVGFLFRQPDIINWVSRPTKVLEYQAVGLKIIHNGTVAWLVE